MEERLRIEPRTGLAIELARGEEVEIVDVDGGQVADLVAVAREGPEEVLSSGVTLDFNGTLSLTRGHTLFSSRGRPLLSITSDDVGRHDFLFAACSAAMFGRQYPGWSAGPTCAENLSRALAEFGAAPQVLPQDCKRATEVVLRHRPL